MRYYYYGGGGGGAKFQRPHAPRRCFKSSKRKKRNSKVTRPKENYYWENNAYIVTKNLLKSEKNEVPLAAIVQLIHKGVLPADQVITLEHLKSAGLLSKKSRQVCLVGKCATISVPIQIECTSVTRSTWSCISSSGGQVICLFLSSLYLQAYLFADDWKVTKDTIGQVLEEHQRNRTTWSPWYPDRNKFRVPCIYVKNRKHSCIWTYSKPIGLQGVEFLHDDFCRQILWDPCILLRR
ncbi:hypothetical protein GAYE_SCF43G5690 [Galdieria yellowstonensis]|uniref:Large ribosomal subunit protein uL15/eL18 domain-containing protein n=1 Tax=Galdieria yellowstonensis TaxID=3028027 RepID=A0AAV9IKC3_9RHOD|nr:hypothetical protein GAYE_SCF43G5690 [Galdieria yellowstonensis]